MTTDSTIMVGYRRVLGYLLVIPALWFALFFLYPTLQAFVTLVSIDAISSVLTSTTSWRVVWFTTWQAVISTCITLAVALPATWTISRFTFPGARWVRGTVSTPFVLPTVVVAGAVMSLLPLNYQFGVQGIIIAHVLFNIAVVIRIVGSRWSMIPHDAVRAAATLGASPTQTFLTVTFPQLRQSIINAATIIFLFSFTSFGVVIVLGGIRLRTIEVEVYTYAVRLGQFDIAMTLALLQIIVISAVLILTSFTWRKTAATANVVAAPIPLAQHPRHHQAIAAIAYSTALIVAAPFLSLFVRSFRVGDRWALSGWRNLWNGSLERVGLDIPAIVMRSLWFAFLSVLIAVPLGYIVAAASVYLKKARVPLLALSSLPLAISAVTLGFGIIVAFDSSPVDWRGETWLLPVIHSLIALPIIVHLLVPALRTLPQSQRDAASTLGAAPLRVWWSIDLRQMKSAITSAGAISFAVSIGEFGATSFLTRSSTTTLPIAIGQLFGRPGTLLQNSGYALAALLAIITGAVMSRA
jgi:thiamine transport system permease protein